MSVKQDVNGGIELYLTEDDAQALLAVLGILSCEGDDNLTRFYDELSELIPDQGYDINEPDDTLKLVKV